MLKWICDQPHKRWYEYIYNTYYANSPHNSKHLLDVYTLTHIFWGIALFLILQSIGVNTMPAIIAVAIGVVLFEIHENMPAQIIRYRRIEIDSTGTTSYRGDTIINVIGDILGNFLGLYLAVKLKSSVALFVLMSLFVWITNIVGLTYWYDLFQFTFG